MLRAADDQPARQVIEQARHHQRKRIGDEHARTVDENRQAELLRAQRRRRARRNDEQHVGHAVGHGPHALVEPAQRFFERGMVRLQLVRQAIAGRGEARLAERLVDESREVMRQRALVAVLERIHLRVVDRLDRIAVQLLEARHRAALLCFRLHLGQRFRTRLLDHRLELVRLLDGDARIVVASQGELVERHVGEEHHLLVIVRLVHAHLVTDHVARCIAQEVAGDALVGRLDALLRRGPGLLAFIVSIAQPLEHAALEEVQEVLLRL